MTNLEDQEIKSLVDSIMEKDAGTIDKVLSELPTEVAPTVEQPVKPKKQLVSKEKFEQLKRSAKARVDKIKERANLSEEEKNKLFQEEMAKLDEKYRVRKEKKRAKIENRATFMQRHKHIRRMSRLFKLGIWALVLLGVYSVGKIYYDLNKHYHDSVTWQKITGPNLASIDPDILYANDEDKQLKLEIVEIIEKIWDDKAYKFTDKVSAEQVAEMVSKYEALQVKPEDNKLRKDYDEITTLWNIRQSIDSLYEDESRTVFNKEASLDKISSTVLERFEELKPYLIDREVHEQANAYQQELYNLTNTLTFYRNLIANVMDNYTMEVKTIDKKETLVVKTDLNLNDYNQLMSSAEALADQWTLVKEFLIPVLEKSKTVIDKNQKNINDYMKYEIDMTNKNDFNQFVNDYNATIKNIQDSVVDLPNFVGKNLSEVREWADANSITLRVTYTDSYQLPDTVIRQNTGNSDRYKKIVQGSTIELVLAKQEERITRSSEQNDDNTADETENSTENSDNTTTSSSSSSSNTSSSSSNSNSSSTNASSSRYNGSNDTNDTRTELTDD